MTTVHYGCTALLGTNKSGVLKPDENGRYTMVLGALEYPNSVGDIYTLRSAQEFFKQGSALLRRIENGQLRAELGHPKKQPGMSDEEYLMRILTIEESKVCAHISDVYIDTNSVKCPKTGKSIIAFIGKVRPDGPYGQVLKDRLDDPKQNVAFSIRSLTMNRVVGFRQHKDFTEIVTWDYVNEPGLAPANKYSVPTLESHQADFMITSSMVNSLMNRTRREQGYSMESVSMLSDLQRSMARLESTRSGW